MYPNELLMQRDQKRCLRLRRALNNGEPTRVAPDDWESDELEEPVLGLETPLMMSAARSARMYVGAWVCAAGMNGCGTRE